MKTIAIGCDPGGIAAKEHLMEYMEAKGYGTCTDFGSDDPIYPRVALKVAEAVAEGEYDYGVLLGGTGLGVTITANKVKGAYAALLTDTFCAKRAKLSNNCNIACIGFKVIGTSLQEELIDAFFLNEYVPGGSSQPKIDVYVDYDMNRK